MTGAVAEKLTRERQLPSNSGGFNQLLEKDRKGETIRVDYTFEMIQAALGDLFDSQIPEELAERFNMPTAKFTLIDDPNNAFSAWLGRNTDDDAPITQDNATILIAIGREKPQRFLGKKFSDSVLKTLEISGIDVQNGGRPLGVEYSRDSWYTDLQKQDGSEVLRVSQIDIGLTEKETTECQISTFVNIPTERRGWRTWDIGAYILPGMIPKNSEGKPVYTEAVGLSEYSTIYHPTYTEHGRFIAINLPSATGHTPPKESTTTIKFQPYAEYTEEFPAWEVSIPSSLPKTQST